MDIKNAVEVAKQHLLTVFGSEIESTPTLEEVWHDAKKKQWCVTLGIRRGASPLAGLNLPEFKTIRLDDQDGHLVSIRRQEYSNA